MISHWGTGVTPLLPQDLASVRLPGRPFRAHREPAQAELIVDGPPEDIGSHHAGSDTANEMIRLQGLVVE